VLIRTQLTEQVSVETKLSEYRA